MSLLTEAVAQEQRQIERMISGYETELSCLPKGVLITKSIKGNCTTTSENPFTTERALKELKYIGQFDAGRVQNG